MKFFCFLILAFNSFFVFNQCNIIYVTPTGSSSLGTKSNPTDLPNGLNIANPGDHLKMAIGTYPINNAITTLMKNDLVIEGGFDPSDNWSKTSLAGATKILRKNSNVQNPGSPNNRISAFELTGISGFRFQDLTIETENASSPYNFGISTYALHLNSCSDYSIVRCQLIAGNASSGTNGANGSNGSFGSIGGNGENGNDDTRTKNDGGNGGTGASGNSGGAKGNGFTSGSSGAGGNANNGSTSTNYRNGGSGGGGGGGGNGDNDGGYGGHGGGVASFMGCFPSLPTSLRGQKGQSGGGNPQPSNCVSPGFGSISGGHGVDGINGVDGCNGAIGMSGSKNIFWNSGSKANDGVDGQGGQGGSGGGGGAGEGNCFPCQRGSGAGGGAGGGGGQGGEAGAGAHGGGSAYAVYIHNNGLNGLINDCFLSAGSLGLGGTGGTGGTKGNGGSGGNGGTLPLFQDYEVGCGGNGGKGGDGGNGGNGGNGSPGETMDIYVNGSPLTVQDIGFNLVAQPTIIMQENFCSGEKVFFSTTYSYNWLFGANSNPSSITGQNVSTIYSLPGRKNITYDSQLYTGFAYVTDLSPDIAKAGIDSIACGNINLYATTPITGTGYWTALTRGTTVARLNDPNSPVTLVNGLNQLEWVVSFGSCCPPTRDTVEIIKNNSSLVPSSILASHDSICLGDSSLLKVVGGSLGAGAQWKWYTNSCGGTLIGTGDSLFVFPVSNTTYYLRGEGICDTTLCVTQFIYINPSLSAPTAILSSADTMCSGTGSIVLTAQGVTPALPSQWYWYADSCNGNSIGSGTSITVNPSVTTTYFLRAESPGTGICAKTTCISLEIIVIQPDTNGATIITSKDSLCPGESTTLYIQGGGLGSLGNWSWYSGSCGGTLEGNLDSLVVNPAITTTYYLRTEGYCGNSICISFQVYVETISTPATAIIASADSICRYDTVTLSVSGGSLSLGDSWHWYESSCGGILVGTGPVIRVVPVNNATYFVRGEGASCIPSDCVSKIIHVEGAIITLLPFDTLCGVLQPVILANGIPVGGTYSGTGVSSESFDPIASGYGNHIITYTYSDPLSGCIQNVSDTLVVESKCATIDKILEINTFSPNGDGINDSWNLSLGNYTTSKLTIFNKWGAKIFESNERIIQWNGNHKGKPLPAGSYFYILEIDQNEPQKGSITIVR